MLLSLVPVVALLFSDSTSPLLCHVARTIRKKVCVNFWVGSTAMLTTDVHLTDTLQFYDRCVRDNGAGPILLFVMHLRPCKHGTHSLRLAVLVRPAATKTWLPNIHVLAVGLSGQALRVRVLTVAIMIHRRTR